MNHPTDPFLNRELSWLAFNERVMAEAANPEVPLLERLFFLSITASNLDEFFMVRVGGVKLMQAADIHDADPAGYTPTALAAAINQQVRLLLTHMEKVYREQLVPDMTAAGLRQRSVADLTPAQLASVETLFDNRIFPLLTPQAMRPGRTCPLLQNLSLYLLVILAPEKRKRTPRYALLPIPRKLPRFLPVSNTDSGKTDFVLVEDVIAHHIAALFSGISVRECVAFRTTRNADIHVDESYAQNLARAMHRVLRRRKTSGCVRLEVSGDASPGAVAYLQRIFAVAPDDTYQLNMPLQTNDFLDWHGQEGLTHLQYADWPPNQPADIDPGRGLFEQITTSDRLLSLPFESFDPFVRFLDEASTDPDVLAIKMVLYRTGKDSPIIDALTRAAANGKSVTALVELKARFDEENNIAWADRLERHGVQVIYGIKGLKTHAKICLVVRQEDEGIVRYVHLGTGNYNTRTAKLYTDVSLFTRNDEFGSDASAFFNTVCGYSEPQAYLKFVQAPIALQQRLVELIDFETAQRAQGRKARIQAKMNALVDPVVIAALYRASRAGVTIDLIVRGICCLRPGLPQCSENIRVISVIDRFLEHSRIFAFHHGGSKQVYISSADWMPRNLNRRIELMVPVENRKIRKRLSAILKACLADNSKAWRMQPDGTYEKVAQLSASGRTSPVRAQEKLYRQAVQDASETKAARRITFDPHLPGTAATP